VAGRNGRHRKPQPQRDATRRDGWKRGALTPEDREPGLARDWVCGWSVWLKTIEDKIAGDLSPFTHGPFRGPNGSTQTEVIIPDNAQIALTAATDGSRARIGAAPFP
jgi:hypothetical protein